MAEENYRFGSDAPVKNNQDAYQIVCSCGFEGEIRGIKFAEKFAEGHYDKCPKNDVTIWHESEY